MRGIRTAVTIVSAACLAAVTVACSTPEPPSQDAHQRLHHLGEIWLETPVSVTYRTFEREAGEAASTHQCLRQFVSSATDVGDAVDVQTGIRLCSGEGSVTFVHAPPDRWRSDVSDAAGAITLISNPTGAYRCEPGAGEITGCTAVTGEPENSRLAPLLRTPDEIVEGLMTGGAAVTRIEDRSIIGLPAECYSAESTDTDLPARADWCFSEIGVLLSFSATTSMGSTTLLEASEISMDVAPTAFDVPVAPVADATGP